MSLLYAVVRCCVRLLPLVLISLLLLVSFVAGVVAAKCLMMLRVVVVCCMRLSCAVVVVCRLLLAGVACCGFCVVNGVGCCWCALLLLRCLFFVGVCWLPVVADVAD